MRKSASQASGVSLAWPPCVRMPIDGRTERDALNEPSSVHSLSPGCHQSVSRSVRRSVGRLTLDGDVLKASQIDLRTEMSSLHNDAHIHSCGV